MNDKNEIITILFFQAILEFFSGDIKSAEKTLSSTISLYERGLLVASNQMTN